MDTSIDKSYLKVEPTSREDYERMRLKQRAIRMATLNMKNVILK